MKLLHTTMWHSLDVLSVLERLKVNQELGLTHVEAKQRQRHYGLNELPKAEAHNFLLVPWRHWLAPSAALVILTAAGFFSLGEYHHVIPVLAVMVLNVSVAMVLVYRTAQATALLSAKKPQPTAPMVCVRRDGNDQNILAYELVPGDILLLAPGHIVAADGRLLEATNLCVQEAALTGGLDAVYKTSHCATDETRYLGIYPNMVYTGTTVTHGHGMAVVVATGMQTELSRIIQLN